MTFFFIFLLDMAKLRSLLALQQFMRGLGEDMDEDELVGWTNEQFNDEDKWTNIKIKI